MEAPKLDQSWPKPFLGLPTQCSLNKPCWRPYSGYQIVVKHRTPHGLHSLCLVLMFLASCFVYGSCMMYKCKYFAYTLLVCANPLGSDYDVSFLIKQRSTRILLRKINDSDDVYAELVRRFSSLPPCASPHPRPFFFTLLVC